jgi:hypothetical protein
MVYIISKDNINHGENFTEHDIKKIIVSRLYITLDNIFLYNVS